jgi:hypothetical protein
VWNSAQSSSISRPWHSIVSSARLNAMEYGICNRILRHLRIEDEEAFLKFYGKRVMYVIIRVP